MVKLKILMNVNTKNPLMKHFQCPKNTMIYRCDLYNL